MSLLADTTKEVSDIWRPVYSTTEDRNLPELKGAEQFRLIDQFGTAHALSDYKGKKSLYLVATKNSCKVGPPVKTTRPVILIAGASEENPSDYKKFKRTVLFDRWQFLFRRYGLERAGDFVEISQTTGQVINRGKVPIIDGNNCQIYYGANTNINFSRDVLRKFSEACLVCHMHFAGTDYFTSMTEIKSWSKMIARSMEILRMPPGGIEPRSENIVGAFSTEELARLYHWAASGANFTETDEINFANERKNLVDKGNKSDRETPDYIFSMAKPHNIPAAGTSYYEKALIGGPTTEDMWIKAVVFSHNLSVLHHSNLLVSSNPEALKHNIQDTTRRANALVIRSFADGQAIGGRLFNDSATFSISRAEGRVELGPGLAAFIPKGSYLMVDNHYQPSGKPQQSLSKVALFKYHSEQPPRRAQRFLVYPNRFTIPAGKREYRVESVVPIEKDTTLLSFAAHMHFRGRSAKLFVTQPGQPKKLLVSIPFYQLKFERAWRFKHPVFLEKGSVLNITAIYDNSARNIANPDSTLDIKFGESTYFNEMHSMRLMYVEGKL